MITHSGLTDEGDERFPVFVDDTGRRRRVLGIFGLVIGALAAAYVSLFVVSLVGSPGLLPLSIPGVGRLLPDGGAPNIAVTGHGRQRPSDVLTSVSPTPSAPPPATVIAPLSPAPRTTARPASTHQPTARARPTSVGSAHRAVPTTTPTARGSSSTHPTPRSTGQPTARPTHPAHPTHSPGQGNGRGASPTASPG